MTITIDRYALIDINTVDLREWIQDVYAVSLPAGVAAVLAAKDKTGPLTEEEIDAILARTEKSSVFALNMGLENGRNCRMHVYWKNSGRMAILNDWPDHDYGVLLSLLKKHNIRINQHGDHHECPCRECKP